MMGQVSEAESIAALLDLELKAMCTAQQLLVIQVIQVIQACNTSCMLEPGFDFSSTLIVHM